jgi:hypothetical protein
MPKIVVYVRAEDSRTIESITGKEIADWTREAVAKAIESWKESQADRWNTTPSGIAEDYWETAE